MIHPRKASPLLLLFIVCSLFSFAQKKSSLLVAEYDDNAASNHLQHLMKYTFSGGAMVGKEEVIAVPTQKAGVNGNYVRFDLGRNQVYRNRYVITSIGNVIDIVAKKLLVAEHGDLVRCSGDSIIFHTDDIFKGKYYSVLDLRSGIYKKVENPNYNPVPRPDVEVDESKQPFVISSYAVSGKQDVLVKDAGYGEAQPLLGEDVKRKFAIHWIDNSNFLYGNFSKDQQSVVIYKVNLNKTQEKIGEILEVPATAANAKFEKGNDGSVIYTCGKGRFLVDIAKKKVEKLSFEPLGNNFFVESDENPKYGRAIKWDALEIGKKWCLLENSMTTSGYGAFQNDIVMGQERYQQGVSVYSAEQKKWILLDVSSLSNIIGWVDEN